MTQNPTDYAWRRRRTLFGQVLQGFWLLAGLVVAAFLAWNWTRFQKVSRAKDAVWAVSGPACPSSAEFAAHSTRPEKVHEIEFDGNTFVRRFGDVTCSYVEATRDPVPVCQFSAPGELRVVTGKGTFNFVPGVGHRATVSVRDGVPQCVVIDKAKR